jgi:hypothetical protein
MATSSQGGLAESDPPWTQNETAVTPEPITGPRFARPVRLTRPARFPAAVLSLSTFPAGPCIGTFVVHHGDALDFDLEARLGK